MCQAPKMPAPPPPPPPAPTPLKKPPTAEKLEPADTRRAFATMFRSTLSRLKIPLNV